MADSTPAPITAADVPTLLLRACPLFAEPWDDVREEYADADNPGGRLGYLDAGAFIRHLVSLKIANTLDEFPAAFGLIERMVVDGDEYVSNLAVIGYIQGFRMRTVTDRGLDPEADFAPWLRPTSRAYWEAICRFWEDGTAIPYIPPIPSAPVELGVVGWAPGLKKVSLTRLLSSELGMSVAEAKAVVDLILSRSEFNRGVRDETAAREPVHLTSPVMVPVPEGSDASEVRRRLEALGLLVCTRTDLP